MIFKDRFLKILRYCNKLPLVLVCVLLLSLSLDAKHQPHCFNKLPDEVMDLPCSFFPNFMKDEKSIYFINYNRIYFHAFIDRGILRNFYLSSIRDDDSFIEYLIPQDFKKRLFFLQRYNS